MSFYPTKATTMVKSNKLPEPNNIDAYITPCHHCNDVKLSNFVLIKLHGERIRDKTTIFFLSLSLFS